MSLVFEDLAAGSIGEAAAFYRRELGRDVDLRPDEQIVVAREGNDVVAAVRLFPEASTMLLRTMVVARSLRGRGVGATLLREFSKRIGARECYCFPWTYLDGFYGSIGFRRIADAEVPAPLRHRLGTPGTIAMKRASPT